MTTILNHTFADEISPHAIRTYLFLELFVKLNTNNYPKHVIIYSDGFFELVTESARTSKISLELLSLDFSMTIIKVLKSFDNLSVIFKT